MPQTLAQKLIARAAGATSVEPDEIVTCNVDLVMMHDLQGPRLVGPMLPMEACDYRVIEYQGEAIRALPMGDRLTLTNMSPELGAKTSVIPPDEITVQYLKGVGVTVDDADRWQSDAGAQYEQSIELDATSLEPQISAPGSPSHAADVHDYGNIAIQQAYIGACTGAKLSDLHMAAEIVRGRSVEPGVRFLIAPASTRTTAEAARDGTLATLTEAGAILLPTGCGACAGMGAGTLAPGEVCITSTARNYKGRMGDIVVGGMNFGCGSSREQAPGSLKYLGVAAVVAKRFARTFYRNAMNIGLPAIVCEDAAAIPQGARLTISIEQGVIQNLDTGETYKCQAIPPHLLAMLNDGGLLGHLEKRLSARKAEALQR